MSGGSYDYLCYKDAAGVAEHRHQVERMAERLEGLGAYRAAIQTRRVLTLIRQLEESAQELYDVWHAVEWRDSCDFGDDQLLAVLRQHEGSAPAQPEHA